MTGEELIAALLVDESSRFEVDTESLLVFMLAKLATLKAGESAKSALTGPELMVLSAGLGTVAWSRERLHKNGRPQVLTLPATKENRAIAGATGLGARVRVLAAILFGKGEVECVEHRVIYYFAKRCKKEARLRGLGAMGMEKLPPPPVDWNKLPIPARFEVLGDMVYDKEFNITWQRCSVGQQWIEGEGCIGEALTIENAGVPDGAGGDWRLPSKVELASIIDRSNFIYRDRPNINERVFPGTEIMDYWTGSPGNVNENGDPTYWAVNFRTASVDTRAWGAYHARLVKDGRP
jgi:hypothetical protein